MNVDQVPLPFVIDRKTTYEVNVPKEHRRDHKVWISNPGSGLEKRQCTLQVCFSPTSDNIHIAVIFRGTGSKISADEKAAYHQDVDVYWQTNAWADTEFCINWVKGTLKPATSHLNEFVLFCDNLHGQLSDLFKSEVSKLGGIVWYGVPNATDIWQPVDSGFGQLLKKLTDHEQQQWLESDENIDIWLGNSEKKLTAKERRILITHWVGEAYKKLQSDQYKNSRFRCFQRTGCLITADGSDDDKITPEGLPGYIVPPPLPTTSASNHIDCETPEPLAPSPDYIPEEEDESSMGVEESHGLEVDNENDRDFSHHLVGKQFRVFYENGWFTGTVTWFNKTLDKIRILYEDGTDDYIELDEVDGAEIIPM